MVLWWCWIWCCAEHRGRTSCKTIGDGHRVKPSGAARCWICRPFGAWIRAWVGDSGLFAIDIIGIGRCPMLDMSPLWGLD
jgi:hypothetical protein